MKKLLALIPLLFLLAACTNNEVVDGFKINCTISGLDSSQAVLVKYGEDKEFVGLDTAMVLDRKFIFEGKLEYPQLLLIDIEGLKAKVKFFAENSIIDLAIDKDSLDKPKVNGSAVHADYENFIKIIEPYEKQLSALFPLFEQASKDANQEELKKLDKKYDEIDSAKRFHIKKFIKDNPASIIAPYAVRNYLVYYIDLDELANYVNDFDTSLIKSDYYQFLNKRVKILQNVAVGKTAPDFTVDDAEGKPVSLSDFRGKYLLVDFWASWCGPCRRENPNVVALYNKYNNKGFEIFGVSFDSKKDNWLKAIEEDKLTWTHASELKGWDNKAGKLYGIISIPHTVLIDKEGVIIAKGDETRGEKLAEKLAEIFD